MSTINSMLTWIWFSGCQVDVGCQVVPNIPYVLTNEPITLIPGTTPLLNNTHTHTHSYNLNLNLNFSHTRTLTPQPVTHSSGHIGHYHSCPHDRGPIFTPRTLQHSSVLVDSHLTKTLLLTNTRPTMTGVSIQGYIMTSSTVPANVPTNDAVRRFHETELANQRADSEVVRCLLYYIINVP